MPNSLLRLDRISENIKNRYQELGLEVKVKDLAYYFDWDNDGIAGNELDDSESVTLSTTVVNASKEGGEYTITIESNKPYYLNPPSLNCAGSIHTVMTLFSMALSNLIDGVGMFAPGSYNPPKYSSSVTLSWGNS